MNAIDLADYSQTLGKQAKAASAEMARASAATKNVALRKLAALLRANVAALQLDNAKDLERARAAGLAVHIWTLRPENAFLPAGLKKAPASDGTQRGDSVAEITAYLVANAGDQGGQRYGAKLLRGVSTTNAPLRITELPKWTREHRKVPDWEWKHKDVRTKANCTACHTQAELGYYDE